MKPIYFESSEYIPTVPCRLYKNYSSDRHNYASNWHREIEIMYIVSGEEFIYIDNECIHAIPGDIVVINRGRIHTLTGESFVHHCLIPSDNIFDNLGIVNADFQVHSHIRDPKLSELFLDIIKEFDSEDKYYLQYRLIAIQKFILTLLKDYEVNYSQNPKSGTTEFIIATKVINYLRQHLSESFSIDEISKELGITTPHMCRCVKSATGISILDHLNIIRCYTAKHLLSHTNTKINEVAQICGYTSSSYFARNYKKILGYSPSETPKY